MVGVLVCTGIFSIAERLVLSILLEDIKAEFALSDIQPGLLTGLALSLFYVTFGFPSWGPAKRGAAPPRRCPPPEGGGVRIHSLSRHTPAEGRWLVCSTSRARLAVPSGSFQPMVNPNRMKQNTSRSARVKRPSAR